MMGLAQTERYNDVVREDRERALKEDLRSYRIHFMMRALGFNDVKKLFIPDPIWDLLSHSCVWYVRDMNVHKVSPNLKTVPQLASE